MHYTKKIAIITAAMLACSSTFAATGTTVSTSADSVSIEMKGAPKLINKTSSEVTLEWEKVEAAANYIVKYSKTSVANSTEAAPAYDNETDPVASTGTTVTGLEANTDYFFAVVAVDKNNEESDVYSDELQVKTDAATAATASGATTTAGLALTEVVAVDNKTVSITFSAPLSTDPVSVKITKISDSSDVVVSGVKADPTSPNKAIVSIGTVLDPSSSYTLTVLSAKDTTGAGITEGVNGIQEFRTLANLPVSPEASLNAPTTGSGTASGALDVSASGALANSPTLPATGTKENLIVLIALMLSFGIVYGYRKKFAK